MDRIRESIGKERALETVAQAIHTAATRLRPPVTGAMHITCADESEQECTAAFHRAFVHYMLPPLKFGQQSAVRLANLGGRYEFGAVRVAEQHFATAASGRDYKLMVVKVNAHVAVTREGDAPHFGVMNRYDTDSPACGALSLMLAGDQRPFARRLREDFASEGKDRVAALLDPARVEPAHQRLYAALVSARLQARSVVLDIQDYQPATPTLYWVIPCVTLNRPQRDTEVVCGFYTADLRQAAQKVQYLGLGDDPSAYRLDMRHRELRIGDEQINAARQARDHRQMVLDDWRKHAKDRRVQIDDERFHRVKEDIRQERHRHHHHSRLVLRSLLSVLAATTPVPAAVVLFGQGLGGIHHAYRMHKLTQELSGDDDARLVLQEIHDRVDKLDHARAEALIELLMREYQG